ncbi:non-ribosomal peptide synthetase [Melittangium boletus]|uniref:Non-ribosomal peptide synthetase n=1 Tax=Melittangium boletus DSM 14713 TaxID=1294270 RepID=A0A250IT23_9BACT|nr:non-ribosomal peptide synthetase [Melittangium boletus]ATB34301.1 non-ribosomal peptide synthetase [Melittangium boletus DSM 14713]
MTLEAPSLISVLREKPRPETLELVDDALKSLVASLFRVSFLQVTSETPLSAYGLDSLRAMELKNLIQSEIGVELPATLLLSGATLQAVAEEISSRVYEDVSDLSLTASASESGAEGLALSFAQERLWFLHQLDPDSTAYNLAGAVRVTGPLSAEAVERVVNEIVRRHESLRTEFGVEGGVPFRRVLPALHLSVPVIDLSALPAARQEQRLRELVAAEEQRPFDLTRAPLLRLTLAELGSEQRALVLGIHHIIADGASIAVFMNELSLLLAGQPESLPALPVQYSDYVGWQRRLLQGPQHERSLRYWLDTLSGELPILELPTDRPRPPVEGSEGVTKSLSLPDGLAGSLRALAARHETTLFTVLLAAFEVVLHRYSGQTDLLIGTPVAGRPRRQLEPLIGFFADTLLLRADTSGRPSFSELLTRTRRSVLEALDHQNVPLGQIVAALRSEQKASRAPLFSAMFTVNRLLESEGEALPGGVHLRQCLTESRTAKFDLDLAVTEHRQGLIATLECRADLFTESTVGRMLEHYRVLLESIARTPELEISRLELLPEEEARLVRGAWNPPAARPVPDVISAFEAQVERSPSAVAVQCGAESRTYRQLNERANRTAHALLAAGASADRVVAILAPRGISYLETVLGVLKAGGAYLVLDPQQPTSRLARVVAESAPWAVLCAQSLAEHARGALAAAGAQVPLHLIESLSGSETRTHNPGVSVPSSSLAYVVFTSGTTGVPKGSLVERRSLSHHCHAFIQQIGLCAEDRVAQHAPHIFDATTWQFLAPLTVGGQVHILSDEEARDPERLHEALAALRITLMDVVPALLDALLSTGREASPSLRRVLVGGDTLPVEVCRRWLARFPRIPLQNVYGPSECTDVATFHDVTTPPSAEQVSVPIGRPRTGSTVYILDRELRLAPVGVAGELYIGGIGVGRGYINRPEWTAERFIPDPHGSESGARLYRTGDLARWRADGQLEFLGRRDQQVKVRGARIELGDIETPLRAHPALRQAVVLAPDDGLGGRHLVAYVVPVQAGAPESTPEALRRHLGETLPAYMVPHLYVLLEELPLTAVGKVDVKALLARSTAAQMAELDYVAPRDEAERAVASIWQAVLGVARVGARSDFFALGGHSLLAGQVISRVREHFACDVPLRHLFQYPTVEEFTRSLASLERRAPVAAIPRAPREGSLALSYAQKRLWFIQQLDPSDTSYHVSGALLLEGELDTAMLERSLQAVFARHEGLRTTFGDVRGVPYPVLHEHVDFQLGHLDARTAGSPLDEARRLLELEAARPFDFSRPLVRVHLVRVASDRYVLGVCLHHIIVDGWSIALFVEELGRFYSALSRGSDDSGLGPLRIHYHDYAAWQTQRVESGALAEDVAYWRSVFAQPVPLLQLPLDRPAPAVRTASRGARMGFTLPPQTVAGIKALCEREDTSLFMFLLTAFNVLLHHYSGSEDITVGTPVAGRGKPELEALIGCFVNTLVLRTDLSQRPTFRELLHRVRQHTLEAFEHQELPFEKLVEEVQPERDISQNPLFQVMFAFQNTRAWRLELPRVRTAPFDTRITTAKFDLLLEMWEEEGQLHAAFEYATRLFDAATVARFTGHFQTLLASIVETPDVPLLRLPLLPEAERALILEDWNESSVDFRIQTAFAPVFEKQVAATPDAVAVVSGDERLTYRELNRRSNRLAHFLISQGVEAESLVSLLDERGIDFLTLMLGVFKAGGAYLPLDPRHPTARHAQLLEQSGSRILLCGRALEKEARAVASALGEKSPALYFLDDILAASHEEHDPAPRSQPGHLAYVIFTSGTTGVPKGAMIDQRGMLNHLYSKILVLGLGPTDVMLQDASQCFDISVWQFLSPLLVGGTTNVFKDEVAKDPARLYVELERHGLTVIEVVPSLLRALLQVIHADTGWQGKLSRLRAVVSNAETLPPEMLRDWVSLYPRIPLYNTYGATECSDDVSAVSLEPYARRELDRLPVGRPVGNMQVYVLNRELRLAPIGVAGELYIGGVAVGRGYFERPELTASVFMPDPFRAEPGSRFYKTGDIGKYTIDGQLDFLGRLDDQVKVRGYRVELSEIESRIAEHPTVQQTVVLARGKEGADKQLVAYVVSTAPAGELIEALKAKLRGQLPGYMVPGIFMVMESFPLNRNGKIDRKALPVPTREQMRGGESFVAPRDELESYLSTVWAEVLKVERVGIHDNFFDLGGHSLMATQVIARVRDRFQRELPLRSLFQYPTIADFAVQALGAQALGTPAARELLVPVPRAERLELSFAQQRFWFLNELNPEDSSYNVHYALRLDGHVDVARLEKSLRAVMQRHESLRTSFFTVEGVPYQRIHEQVGFVVDLVDLSEAADPEREARQRIEHEAERTFDLSQLPLFRITLFRLAPETHVLFLNMHHIICDGWSMGIFIQEVGECYAAFLEERAPRLPPLPIQSYDHAAWQRRQVDGALFDRQLTYWREVLGKEVPYLELPLDFPRPRTQSHHGAKLPFSLGGELSQAIQTLCQREGVTLYMVLQAALATLLHRVTRSRDVTVGSPIAGRSRPELEGLIGCFINTFVLRVDLSERQTFRQLLAQVRKRTLEAYDNQDVSFERIVEEVLPHRDAGANPLFQVMFVLHNLFGSKVSMPGVDSQHFDYESRTAKFDLLLALWETEGLVEGEWEYNTDLFKRSTVERLHEGWVHVLRGVTEDMGRPLEDYPLMSEAAVRAEVVERNRTDRSLPELACFHELFAQRARTYAGRVAAVCDGRSITYEELDARANQIAHTLIARGLKPESVVSLMLDRGLDYMASILGVWKAGGAYMPVDLGHPERRIASMLELGAARFAISSRAHAEKASSFFPASQVLVIEELPATAPRTAPEVRTELAQLAYVIFTSGSTGVPKGAMLHHHGMLNHLFAKALDLGVGEQDVVAQIAVQTFDVSIWQMFSALLMGGRTAVLTGDDAWDPKRLFGQIQRERITVIQSVPAHMKAMLAELESAPGTYDLSSLRWLIMNGEGLPPDLCQRWFALWPRIPMMNMYGLTECSDDSCHHRILSAPSSDLTYMPINGTLQNHKIYVLDDALRPVPIGVAGELCIGGLGVGRGYAADPERTARVFVPDPFSAEPGARMYRTGDRVRYLDDGSLVFLERLDHQIKLRGRRIDIGEIETALREHAQIKDAVVKAFSEAGAYTRLVAYMVPRIKPAPLLSNVILHLQERVPEYMVPTDFVYLDEFPLTDNGKLDRKALPPPTGSAQNEARQHRPPATETQRRLAEIWSRLLGVSSVGLDDNYFSLGGHSLAAAEMTTKARKAFDIDIPLRVIFESPLLGDYAEQVDRLRMTPNGSGRKARAELDFGALTHVAPQAVYDVAPQQIPEWYAYTLDPDSPVYNITLTLFLDGAINSEAYLEAWNQFIARHQVFRARFDYQDGKPIQVLGAPIRLEASDVFIDRRHIPASEVRDDAEHVADGLGNQLFDLHAGPLFRTRLVTYPDQRHMLVFVIHHIVWDETSTINMIKEFSQLYNQLATGQRPGAPVPRVDYLDYAQRMHDAVRDGVFDQAKAYWLRQFETVPPALALPTDHPRPGVLTYDGSTVDAWFERETVAKLQAALRESNVTLFMFLLAVLNAYLYRLTGNDDIVIGSPIANRDDEMLRDTLGLFATPLPLRARMNEGMTFSELLRQMSSVAIEGYENHGYPSNLLIEQLPLPKDLSRPRLFSVMYGVQNNKTSILDHFHLEGVKISLDERMHGAEWTTARFDLTLVVDQFGDDVSLALNYNSRLFERPTAQRMLREFIFLVNEVLNTPDQSLWDYGLMPGAEARRLLTEFNQTQVPFSREVTVAHLIAQRAAAVPEEIAVLEGEHRYTYAQLQHRALQIGGELTARGVRQGDRVGVLLEPSFELLASLVGILGTGAAYVPLLPDYPEARIRAILADSGIRQVLTVSALREKVEAGGVAPLLLDAPGTWSPASGREVSRPPVRATPGDVAYVIYTSGTTGLPKGIEIEHQGLVNYLEFLQRRYTLERTDCVLMTSSYVFDASIVEIFWPLVSGARVAIASSEQRTDPAQVNELLSRHGVSVLQGVPLFLAAVADARAAGSFSPLERLRLTIVGGAALHREVRDKLLRVFGGRLMNHYGPTEVTVDASTFDCSRDFEGAIVPIGRPIDNARLFILDRRLRPVPIGVTGDIYVASPGLARGYLGDPQRTAEVFLSHSLDGAEPLRLYRTGDVGKYDAEGTVYYLGRSDKQVKIRGNRVELEEINARLSAHPSITSCVVKAVDLDSGSERLLAYLELSEAFNGFTAQGATYRLFTLAQRPELLRQMEAAHLESWPQFFAGDSSVKVLWPRIWTEFPEYQFALVDEADQVVAAGNAVPSRWSGEVSTLPSGWSAALERALSADRALAPDTLLILTGVVLPSHQSRGLASCVLEGFKALTRGMGLARAIVPVRPTGKSNHPELSFTEWCEKRRADGLPEDAWLRIHERVGGRPLGIEPRSQRVVGTVAQWECWTEMRFPVSGEYHVPGGMGPVRIDLEKDVGEYDEPSIWYQHFADSYQGPAWAPLGKRELRTFLADSLPEYMIPEQLRFVAKMPRTPGGKIDERKLPEVRWQAGQTAPPQNPLQHTLAELFRDVLSVEKVGIGDDFFYLGGQSLKAIRLLTLVTQRLGVRVVLKDFYREPTILGLERLVGSAGKTA